MKTTERTGFSSRQTRFGLTNNQLKIIAMVSMLLDHVGMELLPSVRILRIIDRLAFPIFAFMIAEGCAHTRNRRAYLLKIAAVALLCQIVYAVAERSLYQSVLVSFTLAILTIFSIDLFRVKRNVLSFAAMAAVIAGVVFLTMVAPAVLVGTDFKIDYGILGIALPVVVYFIPTCYGKYLATAAILLLMGAAMGGRQWYALLAVPVLSLYNGRRGILNLKYLFYIFYPAHLAVIYLISLL